MRHSQAIVVGSSAVGGVCAKSLAERGVDTLVLEEHHKPGKFHKCSGIMSKAGLSSLGVSLRECTLNEVRGARVFADSQEMRIEASSTKGVVIDRQKYDEKCAEEALEAGARLVLNARAEKIVEANGGFTLSSGSSSYCSSVLIGCDGANSAVARELAFPNIGQRNFVLGWEGEFTGAAVSEPHLVHVYLDASLFKGFFGWLIPVNDETVRIGYAAADFPLVRATKEKFFVLPQIAETISSSTQCACSREFNYVIPLRPRSRTQTGNALLCGDAAGQVKATTGGGVVFGGKCAQVAAEETAKHVLEGKQIDYERQWRAKYGGVLQAHYFLRRLYNFVEGVGDGALLKAGIAAGNMLGLNSFLSRKGDMDFIVNSAQ